MTADLKVRPTYYLPISVRLTADVGADVAADLKVRPTYHLPIYVRL